jgi:formylglycine-generating enzyme required for sulfatase activity
MVHVPGGTFVMGSTDKEVEAVLRLCNESREACQHSWFTNEQPAHKVSLDGFWIDRTEVTNAQFATFLNTQSAEAEDDARAWGGLLLELDSEHCLIEWEDDGFRPKEGYANYPVVKVSWYGAKAYCTWASAQLPTEAEREYAARGRDQAVYPWGDSLDGNRLNCCDVNCPFEDWRATMHDDGYAKTAPVGYYPDGMSWCGVLDMAGNVWEWGADRYGEDYYAQSPTRNPQGPESGQFRVQRGGAWTASQRDTRSACRHQYPASWQDHAVGFRCATSKPGKRAEPWRDNYSCPPFPHTQ